MRNIWVVCWVLCFAQMSFSPTLGQCLSASSSVREYKDARKYNGIGDSFEFPGVELSHLHICKMINISPELWLYDGENAFADQKQNRVYLGTHDVDELVRKFGNGGLRAYWLWILAHEDGHFFQYKMVNEKGAKWGDSTPIAELQADVLSGMFMYAFNDFYFTIVFHGPHSELYVGHEEEIMSRSLDESLKMVAAFADNDFNSKDHHGTAKSRKAAVMEGFLAAKRQKFGSTKDAFKTRPLDIFNWSKQVATQIYKNEDRSLKLPHP